MHPSARPFGCLKLLALSSAVGSLLLLNLSVGSAVPSVLAASPLIPTDITTALAVGGNHTCALPGDGTVLCWGADNAFGQLGFGQVTDPHAPAGDVAVIHVVVADAASAGGGDCVDVVADGSVIRCHGAASLTGVTAIAAGYSHTCALLAGTTVKCWGSNAATTDGGLFGPAPRSGGELGDGTTTVRPAPINVIAGPGQAVALSGVRALSAATGYTCAVLTDDTAKCWGDAPQETSLAPITVMADASHPLTRIATISAGDSNACAALLDGSVVCWGHGLLGDQFSGAQGGSDLPVRVTVAGAPTVDLGGIKAVSLGHNVFNGPNGFAMGHSCALDTSGGVVCWGFNDVSQLGNGFNGLTGGLESERDYAVPVISAPGSSDPLSGVTALAAGGYFTCALIDDGSVKCWGLGFGGDSFEGAGAPVPLAIAPTSTAASNGGIALAGFNDRSVLTAAATPLASVVAIAAGGGICAALADGSLWCLNADNGMVAVPGVVIAASSAAPVPTPIPTSAPTTSDPDGLVGDWGVTYGSPTVLTVSFANGTYSMTAKSPVQVTGSSCFLPTGTLIATFSGSSGTYSGQHGLWWITNCAFANWAPMAATLGNGGQTITATLTGLAGTTVFTRQSPPAPSPTPVVAPAEAVIGGWQNGHFAISYQDGLYSITQKITTAVSPGSSCQVPAGTVTYTFSGSGGSYSGQEVGWILPACTTTKVPVSLTFDGNTLTIVHLASGTTEVWQRSTAAAAPTAFRNSIPLPWQLNLSPEVVVPALVVGVGMILLVPFPGALFNSTLRTNYAEIMRRGRRARRRARNTLLAPWFALRTRFGVAFGPTLLPLGEEAPILTPPPAQEQRHDFWWTLPGVGLFIFLTALLSGFLDPSFWFNSASIATFVGMLIGLVLILLAFDLPSLLFYRRHALRFWPRALPATLLVSIASVLISRLTDFHPGYLYGLIITVAVAGKLEQPDEGRLLALGAISTIAIAVAAWFALGLVAPAAAASSDPLLIAVQTVLSMVVAAGVQVAAFGMLPLSFLAGDGVRKWNKAIWAGIWFFGIFAFFIVILNPQNGYLSDTTRTPFLTIIALLVFFAGSSLMFWEYFRRFHKRLDRAADVQA